MNTTQLINKFKQGETLTDGELVSLYNDCYLIEKSLEDKGDMFYSSLLIATQIKNRVEDIANARGI